MSGSILNDTKKVLGLAEDDTSFDLDIIMQINTVFSNLNQLGIGPEFGFEIEDASPTWDHFYGDDLRYAPVKSLVAMRVRLAFDPPATSFHIDAIKAQISEIEWRLSILREGKHWVPPVTVIDGGDAIVG